jgi:hypothetical protein
VNAKIKILKLKTNQGAPDVQIQFKENEVSEVVDVFAKLREHHFMKFGKISFTFTFED